MSLKPIRSYSDAQTINIQSKQDNVFMLDQFTLSDKQMLLIEINEKNGVRNQKIRVLKHNVLSSKQIELLRI